ncbi:MAG: hypothetical protein D6811_01120 [Alphaproteobacteria bacterium]|nr:MAG: hypothetical protein D6811_01120 [Alphaproteobacteria bacterium]
MMGPANRLLSAFLVAVLLATSGAMAAARGQTRSASGEIVLCTGTGPVSMAVDARGKPLGKLPICPDCALALFVMDAPAPLVIARSLTRAEHLALPRATPAQILYRRDLPEARGPPAA